MSTDSPEFQQAKTTVLERLASSGVDAGGSPAAVSTSAGAAANVTPEGATVRLPDSAPASPPDPATVKVPAGLPPRSQAKPKAAQNGSGSTSETSGPAPFRGRPPEHQAQMRRMNALTNAVAVLPALAEKPTTVRAVLRLAAHFERWVGSGVIPEA